MSDHQEDDDQADDSSQFDFREKGDFVTRYPIRAWVSISLEAIYLAIIFGLLLWHFIMSMAPMVPNGVNIYTWFMTTVVGPVDGKKFQYFLIGLAGALGGTLFSAKWLIHTVAKGIWNEDRRLWRLFVPFTSGVTSVIFAAIFQSGLISLFNTESFKNLEVAFAFGALVGYFSDAVVGVMSNMAGILFGTVRDRGK